MTCLLDLLEAEKEFMRKIEFAEESIEDFRKFEGAGDIIKRYQFDLEQAEHYLTKVRKQIKAYFANLENL